MKFRESLLLLIIQMFHNKKDCYLGQSITQVNIAFQTYMLCQFKDKFHF